MHSCLRDRDGSEDWEQNHEEANRDGRDGLLPVRRPCRRRAGPGMRSAAAAPVVDVAARKAALSKIPEPERGRWCVGSMRQAQLARRATITGPVRRQQSNAQAAGNALFGNVANYYRGSRDAQRIGSATPLQKVRASARSPSWLPTLRRSSRATTPMNEPVFQVANFMVPLAHAYLILKEEYPSGHRASLLGQGLGRPAL